MDAIESFIEDIPPHLALKLASTVVSHPVEVCKVLIQVFFHFNHIHGYRKRDLLLEKQIQRKIVQFRKCPSYYGTQIINPFLSLMISANHYKVEGF